MLRVVCVTVWMALFTSSINTLKKHIYQECLAALLKLPTLPGVCEILRYIRDDDVKAAADAAAAFKREYTLPTNVGRGVKVLNTEGAIVEVVDIRDARLQEEEEKRVKKDDEQRKRGEKYEKEQQLLKEREEAVEQLQAEIAALQKELGGIHVDEDIDVNTCDAGLLDDLGKHYTLTQTLQKKAQKYNYHMDLCHRKRIKLVDIQLRLPNASIAVLTEEQDRLTHASPNLLVFPTGISDDSYLIIKQRLAAPKHASRARQSPPASSEHRSKSARCTRECLDTKWADMSSSNREHYTDQNHKSRYEIKPKKTTRKSSKTYCICNTSWKDQSKPSFCCCDCERWFHYECLLDDGYDLPTIHDDQQYELHIPCPKCLCELNSDIREECDD
jgi:hypothetical protein